MYKKIATIGAIGLAVTMAPADPALSADNLKLHIFIPPIANPVKTFLNPWIKKLDQDSGGKLKVTLFPSMQLGGKPPQLTDQAKDGIVDIVWTLPSYNTGRFPISEVFELPFVHTNSLATTMAIQDFQPKHLVNEYKDYHPLLLHVHDGVLIMSRKPITKVADLKGVKIRILNRAGAWYFAGLGANPIGAPLPQLPQMLAKGVVTATTLPFEIAPAVKMQDLVSHFSQMSGAQARIHTGFFSLLMNKASYRKLSPEQKAVLDKNSGRNIAAWAGQNWRDIEKPGERVMRSKKKNKFYTISPEETAKFKAAAKPVVARWVKEMDKRGFKGQALYDEAVALVQKHTK